MVNGKSPLTVAHPSVHLSIRLSVTRVDHQKLSAKVYTAWAGWKKILCFSRQSLRFKGFLGF